MLVLRFRVQCRPDKAETLAAAMGRVPDPSRRVPGVISFDIGRDVSDPNVFIATEVFADAAARERQEQLAEVSEVMGLLPDVLAAPPEATIFHVSSTESAL